MVQSNSSLQPKNHSASPCKEVLIGTSASTDCWLFKGVAQELVFQIIPKGQQRWRSFSEPGSSQGALSVGAERAAWKCIFVSSHRSTDVNGKCGVSCQEGCEQTQCRPRNPEELFSVRKIVKKCLSSWLRAVAGEAQAGSEHPEVTLQC